MDSFHHHTFWTKGQLQKYKWKMRRRVLARVCTSTRLCDGAATVWCRRRRRCHTDRHEREREREGPLALVGSLFFLLLLSFLWRLPVLPITWREPLFFFQVITHLGPLFQIIHDWLNLSNCFCLFTFNIDQVFENKNGVRHFSRSESNDGETRTDRHWLSRQFNLPPLTL